MRIKDLKLNHFRNLNLNFKPVDGFNIISGGNAHGKSNFLDALNIISTGNSFKSFRNEDNLDFVSKNEFAKAEILLQSSQTLKLANVFTINKEGKVKHSFLINDKSTLRNKYTYLLKTLLFTPASLEMLLGSPEVRRDELDNVLSTFDSEFTQMKKDYSFIIRSRNKLLYKINQGQAGVEQLSYWTDRLINVGSDIIFKRIKFLEDISAEITKTSQKLFNESSNVLRIEYMSSISSDNSQIKDALAQKIKENLSKEILLKRTLYGPHRDDLQFSMNERNLHVFGSRGEQRLATMVFKMSAADYLTNLYKTKLVYLLDDIFSELDAQNKNFLIEYVREKDSQVFITTANRSELPDDLGGEILDLKL